METLENDRAIDYLVKKCEYMIEAASPFLSWEMYRSTEKLKSCTPLKITVGEYEKVVTLGDWQKMFILLNQTAENNNVD